ncbi:MAG: FAD-binding protein, partial [Verrucomicrobia bacterium]|nr:FAD-binding protein [Verrucomicrobiota bacterium]
GYIKSRFPTIYARCLEFGIDMTKEMIPVAPAAHYMCGGIRTDTFGRTSVPGLFALGECACTGVHGANRLASNSLSESLVFGTRAIAKAAAYAEGVKAPSLRAIATPLVRPAPTVSRRNRNLRRLMWRRVGIVRTEAGLDEAVRLLKVKARYAEKQARAGMNVPVLELRNLATVGLLVARAARWRTESRGTHFVAEHPKEDRTFLKHYTMQREA